MLKTCKYCKNEFESRINKTFCCKKEECIKQKNSEKYKEKLYKITCIVCNKNFDGNKKQLICSNECKEKYNTKNIKINQKIYCKKCSTFIKQKYILTNVYGKNTIAKEKHNLVCAKCKESSFESWGEKQKGENNSNWKEIKKIRKNKYTELERKEFMSLFNPMKDEQIKLKASKTLKEKYENEEIERPLGKLSPLWKGNRKKSFTIRDRIGWWKKENLERTNYKCEKCNKGGRLEVHHDNKPFREILSESLNGRILENMSYDDFEIICQETNEMHKKITGLVVCKKCHSEIDEYRKIKNDEDK